MKDSFSYIRNIALGLYFGFPRCCVAAFSRTSCVTNETAFVMYERFKGKGSWGKSLGTKYVRCYSCETKDTKYPVFRRLEYLDLLVSFGYDRDSLLEEDDLGAYEFYYA